MSNKKFSATSYAVFKYTSKMSKIVPKSASLTAWGYFSPRPVGPKQILAGVRNIR